MEKTEECLLQTHTQDKKNKMYLIDGVQVEKEDFILPVENIGVWRGDGIFEAIRIHEGYPFGIDLHIERFKKSASKVFFDDINFFWFHF